MTLEFKEPAEKPKTNLTRLKIFGVILTLGGIILFAYFIYSVGITEILDGISKIGVWGFIFILFLYLLRICVRAFAWKLSVHDPFQLSFGDTLEGVFIGEAVSSMIPLGILASGTSKAVAVSNRVPLVVGFSSVATENLFYSFITAIFIISGAVAFLFNYSSNGEWVWAIYLLILVISILLFIGVAAIIRQWHLASETGEWVYKRGFFRGILADGRLHLRLFENIIFDFYRRYPKRFLPISLCQVTYHALGIIEVWYILRKISFVSPTFFGSFLLESVSRVVTIFFKLIPFAIGVDEASSQFISETLGLGIGVGVTIAILRKGRILFWALIGIIVILYRGLNFKELLQTPSDRT